MYKLLMLAALLILPCGIARADTGNDLFQSCEVEKDNNFSLGTCLGYVVGAADAFIASMNAQNACWFRIPPNVNKQQMIDITVKYLNDHPEQRQYRAADLIFVAIVTAFPCPK
jgi:hypothetical protein